MLSAQHGTPYTCECLRSLGVFRKGKTCIIAKVCRTNVVICSHSRGGNPIL